MMGAQEPSDRVADDPIVTPRAVLPIQWFGEPIPMSGERRLMLATLEDALHTYLRFATTKRGREKNLHMEIGRWLKSQDRSWPFSFENICDTLEIDALRLRKRLFREAARRRGEDPESTN